MHFPVTGNQFTPHAHPYQTKSAILRSWAILVNARNARYLS
jgi:hypothetical protein